MQGLLWVRTTGKPGEAVGMPVSMTGGVAFESGAYCSASAIYSFYLLMKRGQAEVIEFFIEQVNRFAHIAHPLRILFILSCS